MVDEQKLRQLAEAASLTTKRLVDMSQEEFHAADNLRREFKKAANPAAILSLLDELQTLREERTAWRVTAENAEKDAARWKHLEYMSKRGIPPETMAYYVSRPDRLDYSAELHREHKDAAMKDES